MLTVVIRAALTAILIPIASTFALAQTPANQAQLELRPSANRCTVVAASGTQGGGWVQGSGQQ